MKTHTKKYKRNTGGGWNNELKTENKIHGHTQPSTRKTVK